MSYRLLDEYLSAETPADDPTVVAIVEGTLLKALEIDYQEGASTARTLALARRSFLGVRAEAAQDTWFERVYIVPKHVDARIVVAVQTYAVEIYNAYREQPRTLTLFINNADAGIVVNGLPSLPVVIQEQDGLVFSFDVTTSGPPVIDGSLDFYLDVGFVSLTIEGLRAILFPLEPVIPILETLSFRTDIITKRDGEEQRRSLRENPRQSFELVYEVDGYDRQFLDTRMFSSQSRVFGVPLWWEPTVLTAPALAGDGTITVESTDFADFRVGFLAILWTSTTVYEAQVVLAITATTIQLANVLANSFPVGTRVMPVRASMISSTVRGAKYPKNVQRTTLRATVFEPGVSLADTSAFPSFNGKVLLSEPNAVEGTLGETYERRIVVVDSETGLMDFFSGETVSRRASTKTFVSRTRQRLWQVRQLLHALRGRAISFYLPTFYDDLIPLTGVSSGGSSISVSNVGLSDLGGVAHPHDAVRILLKSGAAISKLIASVSELDAATEQITITGTWGTTALLEDIDRVEFLEETRLDGDEVQIKHLDALGGAVVSVATKTVNE